jgi:hypothetical protein
MLISCEIVLEDCNGAEWQSDPRHMLGSGLGWITTILPGSRQFLKANVKLVTWRLFPNRPNSNDTTDPSTPASSSNFEVAAVSRNNLRTKHYCIYEYT